MSTSYRHQLLETFGLDGNYTAIGSPDLKLRNDDEPEPFGEIVTHENGHTILRVGQAFSKGPTFTVRR